MAISNELAKQLKEKYNAEGTTLRLAQLRMLEMLKFIDNICQVNNITYWISGGTLLGAIRHGGFIPWDDDADICMPYKDAEKLKKLLLTKEFNNNYVLQCNKTDEGYFGPWYILRDKNSEYIQTSELHKKRKYRGLQVDIFIVEDRGNKSFWNLSLFLQKIIDRLLHRIKNTRIAIILSTPIYSLLHYMMIPLFRHICKENNYYMLSYGSIWKYKLKKKDIYPLNKYTFENSQFNIPHDYDAYLTTEFGNWKEIPNNIWTHQATIILK